MQIGVIGLGKMGFNLVQNMKRQQLNVAAYDISSERLAEAEAEGIQVYQELVQMVRELPAPRAFWMMIPAGPIVDEVLTSIKPHLQAGDIVIDGGNSNYKDSVRRAEELQAIQVDFLDAGSSGGTSGALNGLCLMVGGPQAAYQKMEQIFTILSVEKGCMYTGEAGSGHFLKMVHNGIEYGMMQAIAEGFEVLEKGPFTYDYEAVSRVWNNGSVIRSWLMELMENAFSKDQRLDSIKGVMNSSGEGKWTVETALDYQVATPVIALSLLMRYRSLEEDTFAGKVVAALRNEFGGHAVVSSDQ